MVLWWITAKKYFILLIKTSLSRWVLIDFLGNSEKVIQQIEPRPLSLSIWWLKLRKPRYSFLKKVRFGDWQSNEQINSSMITLPNGHMRKTIRRQSHCKKESFNNFLLILTSIQMKTKAISRLEIFVKQKKISFKVIQNCTLQNLKVTNRNLIMTKKERLRRSLKT